MQDAETLLGVIRDRGSRGLPLERVYRHLFNRELYLKAFARISANKGALTPGATAETADGMSLATIDAVIEALRFERYRWTPARRVWIEKKRSTSKRPLGIPVWSDKLLQEVLRLILEAYYEPQLCPRARTGFGLAGAVTRPFRRSGRRGWGQPGSSKETSPSASTASTTRSCCRSWPRRSTTAASCGSSRGCSRQGTWRTGRLTPP